MSPEEAKQKYIDLRVSEGIDPTTIDEEVALVGDEFFAKQSRISEPQPLEVEESAPVPTRTPTTSPVAKPHSRPDLAPAEWMKKIEQERAKALGKPEIATATAAYDLDVEALKPKSVHKILEGHATSLGMSLDDYRKEAEVQGLKIDYITDEVARKGRSSDGVVAESIAQGIKAFEVETFHPFESKRVEIYRSKLKAGAFGTDVKDAEEVTQPREAAYSYYEAHVESLINNVEIAEMLDIYGSRELGYKDYVRKRTEKLAKEKRISSGDAYYHEKIFELKRQALKEIAVFKTIGVWTAPVFLPEELDPGKPMGVMEAMKPTVEIVGLNNKGQIVARQEGSLQYVLEAVDFIQAGVAGIATAGEFSWEAVAEGIAGRRHFFEASEYAVPEDADLATEILARGGGLVATIFFPDLLFGAAGVAKLLKGTRKIPKEALNLLDEIAAARAESRFTDAAQAESTLYKDFRPLAEWLDRVDAMAAERLAKEHPDMIDLDLAQKLFGEAGAHKLSLHPSYRLESFTDPKTGIASVSRSDRFDTHTVLDKLSEIRREIAADPAAARASSLRPRIAKNIASAAKLIKAKSFGKPSTKKAKAAADEALKELTKYLDESLKEAATNPEAWFKALQDNLLRIVPGTSDKAKSLRKQLHTKLSPIQDAALRIDDPLELIDRAEKAVRLSNETRAAAAVALYEASAGKSRLLPSLIMLKGRKAVPADLSPRALRFADELQDVMNISKDKAQFTARLADARARSWARRTGQSVNTWWDTRIAGVKTASAYAAKFKSPALAKEMAQRADNVVGQAITALPDGYVLESVGDLALHVAGAGTKRGEANVKAVHKSIEDALEALRDSEWGQVAENRREILKALNSVTNVKVINKNTGKFDGALYRKALEDIDSKEIRDVLATVGDTLRNDGRLIEMPKAWQVVDKAGKKIGKSHRDVLTVVESVLTKLVDDGVIELHALDKTLKHKLRVGPIIHGMDPRAADAAIAGQPIEYMVAWVDDVMFFRKRGTKKSVPHTDAELEAVAKADNLVVTHNHPNYSWFSGGRGDLGYAAAHNCKEMRVVWPDGTTVIVEAPNGWGDLASQYKLARGGTADGAKFKEWKKGLGSYVRGPSTRKANAWRKTKEAAGETVTAKEWAEFYTEEANRRLVELGRKFEVDLRVRVRQPGEDIALGQRGLGPTAERPARGIVEDPFAALEAVREAMKATGGNEEKAIRLIGSDGSKERMAAVDAVRAAENEAEGLFRALIWYAVTNKKSRVLNSLVKRHLNELNLSRDQWKQYLQAHDMKPSEMSYYDWLIQQDPAEGFVFQPFQFSEAMKEVSDAFVKKTGVDIDDLWDVWRDLEPNLSKSYRRVKDTVTKDVDIAFQRTAKVPIGIKGLTKESDRRTLAKTIGDLGASPDGGKRVAGYIAENAESDVHRTIAQRIIPHLDNTRVEIAAKGDYLQPEPLLTRQARAVAAYNKESGTTTITLQRPGLPSTGVDSEAILHELVHAATSNRLYAAQDKLGGKDLRKAYSALRRLQHKIIFEPQKVSPEELARWESLSASEKAEDIRDGMDPFSLAKGWTGARRDNKWSDLIEDTEDGLHEMIAWGLTNKGFQEYLQGIKYEDKTTAFDKFVQFIADLLNIPPKEHSAFTELIRLTDDILKVPFDAGAIAAAHKAKPQNFVDDFRKHPKLLQKADDVDVAAAVEGLTDLKGNPPKLNEDGTITLYHRTTPESAAEIRRTGKFIAKENTDEVFFSSKPTGQAEGYGLEVVEVRVAPNKVRLDDAFDDEIHVAVKADDAAAAARVEPEALPPYDPATRADRTPLPEQILAYHFGRKQPSTEWDPRGPFLGSGEGFPGGGPLGKGTYFGSTKSLAGHYRTHGGKKPTLHEVELDTSNMLNHRAAYDSPKRVRLREVVAKHFPDPDRRPQGIKDLFRKTSRANAYKILDEAGITGFYTRVLDSDEIVVFDPSIIRTTQTEEFFDAAAAGAKTPADVPEARRLYDEMGVESPYFKRWFGESKVVDDAGEPIVVYHGTTGDFDTFSESAVRPGWYGRGTYFSDRPQVASVYAGDDLGRRSVDHASIIPSYLSIKNPLEIDLEAFEPGIRLFDEIAVIARRNADDPATAMQEGSQYRSDAIREYAVSKGHDGVIAKHERGFKDYDAYYEAVNRYNHAVELAEREAKNPADLSRRLDLIYKQFEDINTGLGPKGLPVKEYVVFEPTQIKSKFNRGTFDETGRILKQLGDTDEAKAAVEFLRDGRAIIYAFEKADVSSIVHELGHIFRRDLAAMDMASVRVVEKWAEVVDGKWTEAAEEKFARAFERYVRDGNPPSVELGRVFEKLKDWLVEVYHTVVGSEIDVNIPDDVRRVFDKLLAEAPPTEAPLPNILKLIQDEIMGPALKPSQTAFDSLAATAARLGLPKVSAKTLSKRFEETGYVEFPKAVHGKTRWDETDIKNLEEMLASERQVVHEMQNPRLAMRTAQASVREATPAERLRQLAESPSYTGKIAKIVATSFFGGNAHHALRFIPPVLRKNILAGTRLIEQAYGEVIHLVGEKNLEKLYSYLGGEKVNFEYGREVFSSGHDAVSSVGQMLNMRFASMSLTEQAALKSLLKHSQSKSLTTLMSTKPDEYSEMLQALEVFAYKNEEDGLKMMKDLFGVIGAPAKGADLPLRVTHEIPFVESLLYHAGVLERKGNLSSATGTELAKSMIQDVARIYGDEESMRAAVLFAGYGHLTTTRQVWTGLGVGMPAPALREFKNWLSGRPVAKEMMPAVQDALKRYGLNATFANKPLLEMDLYIPRVARDKLVDALARGSEQLVGIDKLVGSETRMGNHMGAAYRFMKIRMTRGAFFVRQRYFLMNTFDHFTQMSIAVGFRPAAASTARVLMQDVMVLPGVARSIWVLQKTPFLDKDAAEKLRRVLQSGGDKAANAVSRLLRGSKYRIEVNPILEGKSGTFKVGDRVYSYRDIRSIAVQEGIFASFDTSQLGNAVRRTGNVAEKGFIKEQTGATAVIRETTHDVLQLTTDTAEAWAERERLGAMITLMEQGMDPRVAARMTIDALYDYAGSMSKMDRAWFVSLLIPFWAFQKNANAQIFNSLFSPWAAFRMGILRRSQDVGPDALTEILYDSVAEPYGIDVSGLSAEGKDNYYLLRNLIENGMGSLENMSPEEVEHFNRRFGDIKDLTPDDRERLENGYGGYANVPKEIRIALGGVFASYTYPLADGKVRSLNQYYRETDDVIRMLTAKGRVVRPDKADRRSFLRTRGGIAITLPMTEGVRKYYSLVSSSHPYTELFIPENTIHAGFRHIANTTATYILMSAKLADSVNFLSDDGGEFAEVHMMTPLKEVVDPARAPITSQMIALYAPHVQYPRQVHPALAKAVEDTFSIVLAKESIWFTRSGEIVDPVAREFEMEQAKAEARDPSEAAGVSRGERYFIPPGAWTLLFDNSPLGEINAAMLAARRSPLEKAHWSGNAVRWARVVTGIQTAETSRGRTARFEEPERPTETVRPD